MVSTSSRCTKLLRAQTGLLLIAWYYHHYTSADMGGSFDPSHHFREPSLYPLTFSFLFCRRRHQPRRPPPANIRPGRPAPVRKCLVAIPNARDFAERNVMERSATSIRLGP